MVSVELKEIKLELKSVDGLIHALDELYPTAREEYMLRGRDLTTGTEVSHAEIFYDYKTSVVFKKIVAKFHAKLFEDTYVAEVTLELPQSLYERAEELFKIHAPEVYVALMQSKGAQRPVNVPF